MRPLAKLRTAKIEKNILLTFPISSLKLFQSFLCSWWRRGEVVITTAQIYSTKPELMFCEGSNPACGVSEIRDGEDL